MKYMKLQLKVPFFFLFFFTCAKVATVCQTASVVAQTNRAQLSEGEQHYPSQSVSDAPEHLFPKRIWFHSAIETPPFVSIYFATAPDGSIVIQCIEDGKILINKEVTSQNFSYQIMCLLENIHSYYPNTLIGSIGIPLHMFGRNIEECTLDILSGVTEWLDNNSTLCKKVNVIFISDNDQEISRAYNTIEIEKQRLKANNTRTPKFVNAMYEINHMLPSLESAAKKSANDPKEIWFHSANVTPDFASLKFFASNINSQNPRGTLCVQDLHSTNIRVFEEVLIENFIQQIPDVLHALSNLYLSPPIGEISVPLSFCSDRIEEDALSLFNGVVAWLENPSTVSTGIHITLTSDDRDKTHRALNAVKAEVERLEAQEGQTHDKGENLNKIRIISAVEDDTSEEDNEDYSEDDGEGNINNEQGNTNPKKIPENNDKQKNEIYPKIPQNNDDQQNDQNNDTEPIYSSKAPIYKKFWASLKSIILRIFRPLVYLFNLIFRRKKNEIHDE